MFDSLSDRLSDAFKKFSGKGRLTEEEVEAGLREVRMALLEADVNFKVARAFVDRVRERASGADIVESLSPGQTMVKIIDEELTKLLGGEQRYFQLASNGRERRAQLMGNIGRKAAGLLERIGKARGHAIKAVDQAIQLVARAAQWDFQ